MKLAARGVIDLRRCFTQEAVERVCERARHLPQAERLLVESVFRHGRSVRELARIHAARARPGGEARSIDPDVIARQLARRLKRAVRRAMSPLFAFVGARVELGREVGDSPAWPLERRRVGEAVVLHGLGEGATARHLGISLHRVREHRRAIEAMFAGAQR